MMSFLSIIRSLFKNKKDVKMNEQTQTSEQKPQPKRKHKLEIQIYEADYEKADSNNGQPQWRPVRADPTLDGGRPTIIEVADKAEFNEIQKQYAMCDQKIKVIREIDPFVDDPPPSAKPVDIPQNNRAIPETNVPSTAANTNNAAQDTITIPKQELSMIMQMPKPKPKIVTIGDIEVKYDGDKVYQKQWMKLTPAESSNFRVVNESNNKIVNLNGKRIEAKRWVLVEEKDDAQNDDVVDNLIGE